MSTLATADLGSEDEDDLDFQLPAAKTAKPRKRRRTGSDSSSASSRSEKEDEVDASEAAKLKADQAAAEAEERRKKAEDAFVAMKNQGISTGTAKATESNVAVELVTVRRARKFAGETIFESIQLPADHPEAIAYLRKGVEEQTSDDTSLTSSRNGDEETLTATKPVAGPSKPKSKGPVRRKPRQSLEAMSAALDKGKKMTTLEKSQMDWKTHTGGDKAINDELEANRRAGGYLQKKDFLERVGERRMGTFDSIEEGRKRQR